MTTFDELVEFYPKRINRRLTRVNFELPLKEIWFDRWLHSCRKLSCMRFCLYGSMPCNNRKRESNSSNSIVPLEFWSNKQSNVERTAHWVTSTASLAKIGTIKSTNCSNFIMSNSEERKFSRSMGNVRNQRYFSNESVSVLDKIALHWRVIDKIDMVLFETNEIPLNEDKFLIDLLRVVLKPSTSRFPTIFTYLENLFTNSPL